MNVCTIVAKNYLAYARVLAKSLLAQHPDATLTVLVLDDIEGELDASAEPFRIIGPGDIGCERAWMMAVAYEILEYSTALKPWLLRTLLADDDHVIYLDPDIEVFSSLDELRRLAVEHQIVLTPHNLGAIPRDGKKPSDEDILIAGSYNLGFIAVGRGEKTDTLLDWWSERLETDCVVDPPSGRFVDQRWIDLVPGFIEGVHVLRDPGYNVAYWNLHSRTLHPNGAGPPTVDGNPLRFFHYSGFDPRHPDRLSKHQNRIVLADRPDVRARCDAYGTALAREGFYDVIVHPYGLRNTASGMRLDLPTRFLVREAIREGVVTRSPFEADGEADLIEYAQGVPDARHPEITRLLLALLATRGDVRQLTLETNDVGSRILREWFEGWGATEYAHLKPLFPRDFHVEAPASGAPSSGPGSHKGTPLGSSPIKPGDLAPGATVPAVNVVGYLHAELGVGEVARQAIGALDAHHVPLLPIKVSASASRQAHTFSHQDSLDNPHPVNLVCVNADQFEAFAADAGQEFFEGKHTIGWWWWEVDTFPEQWMGAFDHVDEIWAGSAFVAETLAAVSPVPVVHVPTPVSAPPVRNADRARLGLPAGFAFLFVFDFNSVLARKNPIGLVDAFRRAFPEPVEDVSLVLKTINAENHPKADMALRTAIGGRNDIAIIDGYVSAEDKNALIASADCYVSLHRAEGFGITLAEAMLYGRPVIATGYSGTADFVNDDTAFVVRHTQVPIGAGADPYPADGHWAEPDLDHAAELMRSVVANPKAARARGAYAKGFITYYHSPAVAGRAMAARLSSLAVSDAPHADRARALGLLQRGPSRSPLPRWHPRRLVRAVSLRISRAALSHHREVIEALSASADERLTRVEAVAKSTAFATARSARNNQYTELALRIDDIESALAPLQDLRAAADAPPFMEGEQFHLFEAEHSGKVMGYFTGTAGDPATAYHAFEDVFRGSEEMVRGRQARYVPLLRDRSPVLDIGCGRGELLDVLRDAEVEASGVDLDTELVDYCRQKGHTASAGEAVEYLRNLPPRSVGAICSIEVVEHLPDGALESLLEAAHNALRSEGMLILETVNPHSPWALKAFWVDLTHNQPIFPEVLLHLCREAGFDDGYIFHPHGDGDFHEDRVRAGEYAVVARKR